MATLIDVAKEAGVSPATVSRVINNSFLVSDEKKQRVYEALEKVGYVIPVKHSAPHSKNGKLLLIVLFNEHPGLCEGLQQQAGELGYSLVYQRMTEYTSEADIINLVQLLDATGQLAGIFMLDYYLGRNADLETLFKRYPVVYIGEASQPDANLISIDDYQAAYDATRHLLDLGRRRIAIYATKAPENRGNFEVQRIRGYRSALMDSGILPTEELIRYTDFTSEGAVYTTNKMFTTMEELPDAIICMNDNIAIGCIRTLIERGLRVPEDIAVLGMDNESFGEYVTPSLTTIAQEYTSMGTEAMQVMHMVISAGMQGSRKIFVPHHLIVRESTAGSAFA